MEKWQSLIGKPSPHLPFSIAIGYVRLRVPFDKPALFNLTWCDMYIICMKSAAELITCATCRYSLRPYLRRSTGRACLWCCWAHVPMTLASDASNDTNRFLQIKAKGEQKVGRLRWYLNLKLCSAVQVRWFLIEWNASIIRSTADHIRIHNT